MSNLTLEKFLNLLFEPDEQTCFTSLPTGVQVKYMPYSQDVFFCINALDPLKDHKPERPYHAENKPRRADHNVVSFRNFLIELDGMPLEEQIEYVTSKIPVSAITYSGGKSYHFILSLEEPLKSLEEYKHLALRLHSLLPKADKSTKNPSRLSRLPTAIRPDTGKEQTSVQIGTRIPLQTLENMLPLIEAKVYEQRPLDMEYISATLHHAVINPNDAMDEMAIESRNRFFFWLGKRMEDLSLADATRIRLVDTAYANLMDATDFTLDEAYMASRIK